MIWNKSNTILAFCIMFIFAVILETACNSPGVQELQGLSAAEQPKMLPSWAAGMPPELADTTYRILQEVMVPENVVMVMVCVSQDRGDGDVGLACMSVHPGVFAIAAEELGE